MPSKRRLRNRSNLSGMIFSMFSWSMPCYRSAWPGVFIKPAISLKFCDSITQFLWQACESWLLCFICLPGVSWWLSGSSSRCHGVVCSLWLWYFLIILTYYFWVFLCNLLVHVLFPDTSYHSHDQKPICVQNCEMLPPPPPPIFVFLAK